jgi:putative transcriptional regulator
MEILVRCAMARKYKSEALAAIHETAEALRAAQIIPRTTMRKFNELCLTPIKPLAPEEIKNIRKEAGVSQPVLARYLNVGKKLISEWERGLKAPSGPSLKLLCLVRRHGLEAIA